MFRLRTILFMWIARLFGASSLRVSQTSASPSQDDLAKLRHRPSLRTEPGIDATGFHLVRYLEPGRKRRRRGLPAVRFWAPVVCVLALALAVQVLVR